MSAILGLDLSTQSCSATVIDLNEGHTRAQCSINYGEHLPHYQAPEGFNQDKSSGSISSNPMMWLEALELCIEDIAKKTPLSEIKAIGGAAQQHGSIYLNEQWRSQLKTLDRASTLTSHLKTCFSRSTAPIWMDTSTPSECKEIADAVGGQREVCKRTGSRTIERFTGPQIRKFYKQNTEGYEKTRQIHLVSSFIASLLIGGDAPVDTGDGAGMNLLNLQNAEWDNALLEATAPNLKSKLPAITSGTQTIGQLHPFWIRKYGFNSNTTVVNFTGDNPSSLVGMGVEDDQTWVISLGTSDTVFSAKTEPISDPDGYGHLFGNPLGAYMCLQCFVNGSLAREKVKNQFDMDWPAFEQALAETPPGNEGNLMLPTFFPEISPPVNRYSPILEGSAEFKEGKHPAYTIRACVEGQCMNMLLRTAWMGNRPKLIKLTGGASVSPGISQIIAETFQAEVKRLPINETVALGAALRALYSINQTTFQHIRNLLCEPDHSTTYSPNPKLKPIYQQTSEKLQQIIK